MWLCSGQAQGSAEGYSSLCHLQRSINWRASIEHPVSIPTRVFLHCNCQQSFMHTCRSGQVLIVWLLRSWIIVDSFLHSWQSCVGHTTTVCTQNCVGHITTVCTQSFVGHIITGCTQSCVGHITTGCTPLFVWIITVFTNIWQRFYILTIIRFTEVLLIKKSHQVLKNFISHDEKL